jgi:hypothetical protein
MDACSNAPLAAQGIVCARYDKGKAKNINIHPRLDIRINIIDRFLNSTEVFLYQ